MGMMVGRDLLKVEDLSRDELFLLLSKATEIKRNPKSVAGSMAGKSVALIFHKPSMRTRVSFEAGAASLGAHPIFLKKDEIGLGERETIADVGRVLSRFVDAIVIRTFAQGIAEELADAADVPVVNALTDDEHPCQALADLMTILEKKGKLAGNKVAYVGDGDNNVCNSLMLASAMAGIEFAVASPSGRQPRSEVVERANALASSTGKPIVVSADPRSVVQNADVVYTDVWVSMGQEGQKEEKIREFDGFQIDERLLSLAKGDVIFMHCLPAHRGEEVSAEVLDSKASVIFDQAENRLHTAKAVLCELIGG